MHSRIQVAGKVVRLGPALAVPDGTKFGLNG
jgi:hypothetical protein